MYHLLLVEVAIALLLTFPSNFSVHIATRMALNLIEPSFHFLVTALPTLLLTSQLSSSDPLICLLTVFTLLAMNHSTVSACLFPQ